MLTTLVLIGLVGIQEGPVQVNLTMDPVGLSFAGTRARNQMYMPSRATEIPSPAGEEGARFTVEVGNGPDRLFTIWVKDREFRADLNQNGNLQDDPVPTVTAAEPREPGDPVAFSTTVVFPGSYEADGKTWRSPYGLNFYWRAGSKGLNYFRAGLLTGSAKIGGRELTVELWEEANRGVFHERYDTVKDPTALRPAALVLQGGRFDPRGTIVVEGVNYLPEISPDGRTLRLTPSFKVVSAPPRPAAPRPTLLAAGRPAPDFTVEKFEGGTTKLSDHKGKVVILKFWATWCGPCKASMPHFQEIYTKVKDQDVSLLAVCVNDERELFKEWVTANRERYTFPFSFDPAGKDRAQSISSRLFGLAGIPTVFILDREGKVVESIVGYSGPDDKRVEAVLQKLGVRV